MGITDARRIGRSEAALRPTSEFCSKLWCQQDREEESLSLAVDDEERVRSRWEIGCSNVKRVLASASLLASERVLGEVDGASLTGEARAGDADPRPPRVAALLAGKVELE